jgi:hypothetical protein
MEKTSNKFEKSSAINSRCFNLWSFFKLLDTDPDSGEPIIYGSGSAGIRIRNTRKKSSNNQAN